MVKLDENSLWAAFAQRHALTDAQCTQFQRYYQFVCAANELFNLTAITQLATFITHHLDDSLALSKVYDLAHVQRLADVGTGAGFPAIPLKIKYPHLALTLIEVTHKKALFLEEISQKLGLSDVSVIEYDWRTFLRKIDEPIDLFCSRASLQPEELIRVFKPSSPYNSASLIYWASSQWEPHAEVVPFIQQDVPYKIGHKNRRLILLKKPA